MAIMGGTLQDVPGYAEVKEPSLVEGGYDDGVADGTQPSAAVGAVAVAVPVVAPVALVATVVYDDSGWPTLVYKRAPEVAAEVDMG
eukprot:5268200-Prorocentrum_lima.AAC.1